MNNAQLQGMRDLHRTVFENPKRQPMSAAQMARVPHALSRCGTIAYLPDGSAYAWDTKWEQWSPWR